MISVLMLMSLLNTSEPRNAEVSNGFHQDLISVISQQEFQTLYMTTSRHEQHGLAGVLAESFFYGGFVMQVTDPLYYLIKLHTNL